MARLEREVDRRDAYPTFACVLRWCAERVDRQERAAAKSVEAGRWPSYSALKMDIARLIVLTAGVSAVCYAGPVAHHTAPIVPGVAMGAIPLGSNGAETLRKLPKPYAHDEGMSQTRLVWKFPRPGGLFDTLFIHTTSNGVIDAQPSGGVTIDLIRTTSKRYRTSEGISVGSTLSQIQKSFPDAAPVDNIPTVYDAGKEGIAFEFEHPPVAQSICIAVMVHVPGGGQIATQENVAAIMQDRH